MVKCLSLQTLIYDYFLCWMKGTFSCINKPQYFLRYLTWENCKLVMSKLLTFTIGYICSFLQHSGRQSGQFKKLWTTVNLFGDIVAVLYEIQESTIEKLKHIPFPFQEEFKSHFHGTFEKVQYMIAYSMCVMCCIDFGWQLKVCSQDQCEWESQFHCNFHMIQLTSEVFCNRFPLITKNLMYAKQEKKIPFIN